MCKQTLTLDRRKIGDDALKVLDVGTKARRVGKVKALELDLGFLAFGGSRGEFPTGGASSSYKLATASRCRFNVVRNTEVSQGAYVHT